MEVGQGITVGRDDDTRTAAIATRFEHGNRGAQRSVDDRDACLFRLQYGCRRLIAMDETWTDREGESVDH